MIRRANRTTLLLSLLLSIGGAGSLLGGGLSTQLGEVVIENLQPGQSYNLTDLANLQLAVTNNSDHEVELVMDVLRPDSAELRHGSAPLPDVSWVKLSERDFFLEPDNRALADIIIQIPNGVEHLGQKYQFNIWSHTLGTGTGMSLAYGLKSRVIFTIDTVRADTGEILEPSSSGGHLRLQPEELHLLDLQTGCPYDLEQEAGTALSLTNPGDDVLTVKLRSLKVANSVISLTPGFEDAPDASFLRLAEGEVLLEPGETKEIKAYIDFPSDPEYVGKRYMFIVHAYSISDRVSTGVYSRVHASLK